MPDIGLLNAKEAARYLKMSVSWLYNSLVPFVKLGSARRYRVVDLDAYVAERVRK
jgi:predicted DNA-binding transcriptional regulator AlpA